MADIRNNSKVNSIDDNYEVEYFTLSALDIANKQVTLSKTPTDPLKVTVDPVGGTSQTNPDDFIVTGNVVDWNGRGLETLLETGHVLRVIYII